MTTPSEIHDDLQRILALAKRALSAREDAAAWSQAPEKQCGHHSACCDALWDELERLVQINDGLTPVIEHPAIRERRIAKQIWNGARIYLQAIKTMSDAAKVVADSAEVKAIEE